MTLLKTFFPYFLITILAGVGFAPLINNREPLIGFLLILGTIILLSGIKFQRNFFFIIPILCAFFILGLIRYEAWDIERANSLLHTNFESQVFEAIVDDEPDVREKSTRLTVLLRTVSSENINTNVATRALLTVPRYPEYAYGDMLRVEGKLLRPKKISEDDGRVFDYPMYLASKGIAYQMIFPVIIPLERNEGNALISTLYNLKHKFLDVLTGLFPEPHNSLLGGLLLGGKQSLGEEWLDIFRTAGIVHIVVLSGYNMTIISEWLVIAFRFMGFYGSLGMGGLGITLFAIMAGAGATVVRAAIMAMIALLARATGKTYTMGRALLVAGVCMVLQNPSILMYDPSFQLSFLASLGLVYVSPVIEKRTALLLKYPLWREVFISTIATQLMVLPLLLYQTGLLSLVALPANLLVLPVIPFTMLFGFVAGVIGTVSVFAGSIFALLPHLLLSWILFVAHTITLIPHASVAMPISVTALIISYVILGVYLWSEHRARPRGDHSEVPPLSLLNSTSDKKET